MQAPSCGLRRSFLVGTAGLRHRSETVHSRRGRRPDAVARIEGNARSAHRRTLGKTPSARSRSLGTAVGEVSSRGVTSMQAYVGVTDGDWFEVLRAQPSIDEVNFWQPSGNRVFRALAPGELFLFKLHSPHNYIVGGGLFAHATILPISL